MALGNEMGERKDGYGSRQVYISTKGAILGLERDLFLGGFSGPRRGPQILPWAARERGRIGDSLGEWDGGEGGRMDMRAGKYISQLREPF